MSISSAMWLGCKHLLLLDANAFRPWFPCFGAQALVPATLPITFKTSKVHFKGADIAGRPPCLAMAS
jgi:hypothetical protein